MMTKEESSKIVNFLSPEAGILVLGRGHKKSVIAKMHHFFKNLLIYSQA